MAALVPMRLRCTQHLQAQTFKSKLQTLETPSCSVPWAMKLKSIAFEACRTEAIIIGSFCLFGEIMPSHVNRQDNRASGERKITQDSSLLCYVLCIAKELRVQHWVQPEVWVKPGVLAPLKQCQSTTTCFRLPNPRP